MERGAGGIVAKIDEDTEKIETRTQLLLIKIPIDFSRDYTTMSSTAITSQEHLLDSYFDVDSPTELLKWSIDNQRVLQKYGRFDQKVMAVFNLSASAINEMSTKQLKQAFKTVGEVQQKGHANGREKPDELKARLVLYVSGNGTGNTSDGTSDNALDNSSDSEFSDYPSSSSDEELDEEEEDTSGGSGGSDGHERYVTGDKEGTCKKRCEKCRNLRGVDEEDLWTDGNGASDEYIDSMTQPSRRKALSMIKAERGTIQYGGKEEERRLLKQYGTNNASSGKKRKRRSTASSSSKKNSSKKKNKTT